MTFDELFDLSAADLLDLTYDGLASVAAAAAATDPEADPTKIAILVSEARGMGIIPLYQILQGVPRGPPADPGILGRGRVPGMAGTAALSPPSPTGPLGGSPEAR